MATRTSLARLARCAGLLSRPWSQVAARTAATAAGKTEDDIVVSVFREEQEKFRQFFNEAKSLEIPLSGDAKAVETFHKKVQAIKTKLKMPSDSQRLQDMMEFNMVSSNYDVKSFLSQLSASVPEDVIGECMALADAIEAETGEILRFGDNPDFQKFVKQMEGVVQAHGVAGADVKQLELEAEAERLAILREEAQQKMEDTKDNHGLNFLHVDAGKLKPKVG